MNIFQSFLLGILQGLTEFIPVSSTAHLLIGQKILGIPSSDATFSFLVLVQLGTILSLIIYFWKELWSLVKAFFARPFSTAQNRLAWYIIIATIPALIFGYLLKSVVESLFKTPLLEASVRLLITACILGLAEWLGRRNRTLEKMTWVDALVIGIAQVLAIFPELPALEPLSLPVWKEVSIARLQRGFAFLMSVPVMLAAGGYQALDLLKMPSLITFLPVLAVGFLTAAGIGWLAIRWLLGYINKHSLTIFAGYCAIVGVIVLLIQLVK